MSERISSLAFAVLLLGSTAAAAETRAPQPQPGCLDARIVETVHVLSETRLAVASSDGRRFAIELVSACADALAPGAQLGLLARDGWVCGGGNEFVKVQGAEGLCPIGSIGPVDSREFARLAREAGSLTLAQFEVRGRKAGFGGSADFCFQAGQVRSWSEANGGLQVVVGQRGRRGSRSYRVELDDTCPDLGRFENVDFQSGVGNGLICGNTGDVVIVQDDGATVGTSRLGSRCVVSEVYPMDASAG